MDGMSAEMLTGDAPALIKMDVQPSATQPMVEGLRASSVAEGIRTTLTEEQLYRAGLTDFVAGNIDTEAARHYVNYWRQRI